MATEHPLPPSASSLSESMRDLGYTLESAIADIIDNSISAHATEIDIFCILSTQNPTLCIIDNGHGMDEKELLQALKHGSTSPKAERKDTDLGRFGLGLKTASFSQCRQLTVATRKSGKTCAAQWDLDLVDSRDDWIVSVLDNDEIAKFDFIDSLPMTGTMVVWRSLDRLFEDYSGKIRDEIVNQKLAILDKHLSLVFHRYLSGDYNKIEKIKIRINGDEVKPFDPFCLNNKATQVLPEEKIRIGDDIVVIQPYILPHHSKLSAKEYDFYQDRSDFISNQGAYIYRNGRLMAWGDWFRLIPKGEATKLARVRVDFQNSMDESWTIDIKKSRARPPRQVRERIRQIISQITSRSTRVHRKRGQKLFDETKAPLWDRFADNGKIRYDINVDHPLLEALRGSLDDEQSQLLSSIISSIAAALPMEMIYSDYSTAPKGVDRPSISDEDANTQLELIAKSLFGEGDFDENIYRDIITSTRLFEGNDRLVEDFIGRMK